MLVKKEQEPTWLFFDPSGVQVHKQNDKANYAEHGFWESQL